MLIVYIILIIIAVYLAAGFIFAIPFILKGVTKIDEAAQGSKWGFRIIIIPGTIVFWPLFLKRWLKASIKK